MLQVNAGLRLFALSGRLSVDTVSQQWMGLENHGVLEDFGAKDISNITDALRSNRTLQTLVRPPSSPRCDSLSFLPASHTVG